MPGRPNDRVLLNPWTRWFLDGTPKLLYTDIVTRIYPDGRTIQLVPHQVRGPADTPVAEPCGERFAAIYPLYRYRFADGREYREIVHIVAKDASGGPIYLLALEDAGGRWIIESFWSASEVAERGLVEVRTCTK